jgi:DnaD/phage-associated family protein
MPTYRKLHTRILESQDIANMPDDFHRLVWTWLPLILTSDGTAIYDARYIRSRMFPLRDDITPERIAQVFAWFEQRGMILPYDADGRRYVFVPTFAKYQGDTTREADSTLPKPPAELGTTHVNVAQSACNPHVECAKDSCSDADADADADAKTTTVAAQKAAPQPPSPSSSSPFQQKAIRAFENTIGLVAGAHQAQEITAMLDDLETRHLEDWWTAALKVAADQNKRSWAYVRGILRNCLSEGQPPGERARASPGGNGYRAKTRRGQTKEAEVTDWDIQQIRNELKQIADAERGTSAPLASASAT